MVMAFDYWMRYGIEQGFCGPPVCETHDGTPTSEWEAAALQDGAELCIHVIRPYVSPEHKAAVEEYHPPSTWRDDWSNQ
jgi:hypothetical protein